MSTYFVILTIISISFDNSVLKKFIALGVTYIGWSRVQRPLLKNM